MLNSKDRANAIIREDRLENEHNDPEFPPKRWCRHCDEDTNFNPFNSTFCVECGVPYSFSDPEVIEYLLGILAQSEGERTKLKTLARLLFLHLNNAGRTADQIGNLREDLKSNKLFEIWNDTIPVKFP